MLRTRSAYSQFARFVVQANPGALPTFEQALFGPFTVILTQDIDRMFLLLVFFPFDIDRYFPSEYIPYVFQILAQMLDLHVGEVPAEYRSLLPFLLTPVSWQQKGSVPGLVKLLKALLSHDAKSMIAAGQLTQVLGVIQQRLIPSKINDGWGFELLQAVVQHVPSYVLCSFCPALEAIADVMVRCTVQRRSEAVLPLAHCHAAHADADEQDGQVCVLLCLLPRFLSGDQRGRLDSGLRRR